MFTCNGLLALPLARSLASSMETQITRLMERRTEVEAAVRPFQVTLSEASSCWCILHLAKKNCFCLPLAATATLLLPLWISEFRARVTLGRITTRI